MSLLAASGGLTEEALARRIVVINQGSTNNYNFWSIKKGGMPDPEVPCGATVIVKKAYGTLVKP